MKKTNVIVNGYVQSNTGWRQVLLDNELNVRPVLYAAHSGYQPERHTAQVQEQEGDILLRVEWGHGKEETFTVSEFINNAWRDISPNNYGGIWIAAKKKHPWLETFLAETSRGSSHIPYTETIVERNKRLRLERFFQRNGFSQEVVNKLMPELMVTPKKGINLDPVKLPFDPNNHFPEYRTHIGSMVDISTKEKWYSIYKGKAVELNVVHQEDHYSNYAYDKPSHTDGEPLANALPEKWQTLVRIVTGAYIRNHHSYGVTIDVYKP